tara:strand:+ start:969 stop:1166 length:198 start_codon:yes stop_codon:yes gene_type:complete
MNLLHQLKKQGTIRGRRWIIKWDTNNKVREVKLIFNPIEYSANKNAKKLYGDREVIKILTKNKKK